MKGHLIVGNEAIEVEFGDMLCLRCKHFDIKTYEKEIIKNKRSYSMNACKSTGVIYEDGNPIACSSFEAK